MKHESCKSLFKGYNGIACGHLFLMRDHQVLLCLRENTGWIDGYYHPVSGYIEAGETIQQGIIREAYEEIGVHVLPEDLIFLAVLDKIEDGKRHLPYFFATKKWTGSIVNKEPHKCAALKFFDLDKLPEKLLPYVRHLLERLAKGIRTPYFAEVCLDGAVQAG